MSTTTLVSSCRISPGTPTGRPVALIHGMFSSSEADWPEKRWITPFLELGRPVIMFDLPAHGRSPSPDDPADASPAKIIAEIASVLDNEAGPVDVVGYSLGARLAWSLAARYPEKVRRLALGGISPREPFGAVVFPEARALVDAGIKPSDPLTAMIAGMVVSAGANSHGILNVMEGLASEPFAPSRESPIAPTLLLGGDTDKVAQGFEALAEFLKDVSVVSVEGDHRAALASDAFNQQVREFLTRP